MTELRQDKKNTVTISAPNFQVAIFQIVGESPYVQRRMSEKAQGEWGKRHKAGSTAKSKKVRAPRDFEAEYKSAMHVAEQGWVGIPASAFRCAMISACRLVDYTMTLAKLSVFVQADGLDKIDGTPLVRIEGKPEPIEMTVRLANGTTSICVRPMWRQWKAVVCVRFDADQFTLQDVTNLLSRAGLQVGVGEGRPDSKKSAGMGWGLFAIERAREVKG